ncbi:YhdT family protein [Gracilibacillus caseinilyticus]|uniref:YhdT family protein n=1 Tax=Gracilibacillus caseinilyticus TaxID=2932256 RepID=A0ABY4ERX8_9BACI|nr:YhdT family protein [Gracilibacillus caseinilyticus]UOQ46730.1 YhdT family protein [Gracilibacillus caseinilyticus]
MMKHHLDKRFKMANREAIIGICLVLFNFIWWFTFAYGLGSKEPDQYTFILGFPAWFFYSCIVGVILMIVLVSIVVRFFFKDFSLDDKEYDQL